MHQFWSLCSFESSCLVAMDWSFSSLLEFNSEPTIRKAGCMRSLIGKTLAAGCVIGLAIAGLAQQVADPDFDTKVANPAYTKKHPKVFLDEAHNNFHTASGRYKP